MIYKYKCINDYNDEYYNQLYINLSNNDKIKIDKLINDTQKKQSILSKHILSKLFKKHFNIDYHNSIIKYNQFDKPYIDNVHYNISHSNEYIIVAISSKPVGIDIEKIRPVKLNIMHQFCTPNECNYINNNPNKYLAFWRIFTLKEAYLKMLGTNLTNIKHIEFIIDEHSNIKCINNSNIHIISKIDINNYIYSIIYK